MKTDGKLFKEYDLIKQFYGDRKAERSDQPLMNHIDEGIRYLNEWRAPDLAFPVYMLHPLFQEDLDFKHNFELLEYIDPKIVALTLEYRHTANAYLSKRRIRGPEEIKLSIFDEVNWALRADKVQNYKDFRLYHGNHPRRSELEEYFCNWFIRLGIDPGGSPLTSTVFKIYPNVPQLNLRERD